MIFLSKCLGKISSPEEIAHDKHILFLRSIDIWLVTNSMENAGPHKRNKSKIARLSILEIISGIIFATDESSTYIEMRCQCKEVHRLTTVVQKATLPEVLDAESKMVQELASSNVGVEADMREGHQTFNSLHCIVSVL
jgi:hypothetical protein